MTMYSGRGVPAPFLGSGSLLYICNVVSNPGSGAPHMLQTLGKSLSPGSDLSVFAMLVSPPAGRDMAESDPVRGIPNAPDGPLC